MRHGVWLLLGGLCGLVGCFAPFTWPEERDLPVAHISVAALPDESMLKAAEALERGDEATAITHMREYVKANPDAVMPRAHFAEMLFRAGHADEARRQYERFVADAQPSTGAPRRQLVPCHTRLVALAEGAGDTYAEALNRGIGLLLIAERDPDDGANERTLALALAALREAQAERPDTSRANFYVSEVYRSLGQTGAANRALAVARANLPDPTLTPTEHEKLLAPAQ